VHRSPCLKADSHIPCRSAKGLNGVSHLIYTVRPCLIHTYHAVPPAVPRISLSESDFSRSRKGRGRVTAWEQHGMCELASAIQRRHIGDLPAFGVFLLPRGVPGCSLSEACQSQMQVASMEQSNVCHGRREASYFDART
jgi:hypothetical protein